MNIKDEFPSAAQSREISDTNLEKVMFDVIRNLQVELEHARRHGRYSIDYEYGNDILIKKLTDFLKSKNYSVIPIPGRSRNAITILW